MPVGPCGMRSYFPPKHNLKNVADTQAFVPCSNIFEMATRIEKCVIDLTLLVMNYNPHQPQTFPELAEPPIYGNVSKSHVDSLHLILSILYGANVIFCILVTAMIHVQNQTSSVLILPASWFCRTKPFLSSSCSQAVSKPIWHIQLLCVQWKTPDDGQRNCLKNVEFYSKSKFEKLVHLVGFIIRVYHDARSLERHIFTVSCWPLF